MRGLVWDENDKTGSSISTDSTDKCGIGDAGEVCDLHGQRPARVHEGLEALTHLTVLDDHRADLGDGLILDVQAGGLDVKGYVFVGKGPLHAAMDGDAVV